MEILKIGDLKLREENTLVSDFEEAKTIINEMKEVINNPETSGLGLAAPQIGYNKKIVIVREAIDSPITPVMDKKLIVLINPSIKKLGKKKAVYREGCLSVPDVTAAVERCKEVKVIYTDEDGNLITRNFKGTDAVVVQHELEHLDGILMIDNAVQVFPKPSSKPIEEVEEEMVEVNDETISEEPLEEIITK